MRRSLPPSGPFGPSSGSAREEIPIAASTLRTPVLIVGGGPVGLALAGDLGWRGVPCTLIERSDGSIYQPRMDLVGVRTMEFCRRWGIVDWVESCPYPRDYPQDNVYVTSLCGYELGREPMPAMADEPPPPQSPQHRERCPQDMFDPILTRFARSFPHVTLRYETALVELHEDADGVEAVAESRPDGQRVHIRAQYVVGADGGASTVRSALSIPMSGAGTLTYTTNVIFRCPDLAALHGKPLGYRFIVIGEDGTWATIVAINGRDRWRMSIIGSEQRWRPSDEEIRHAIVRAVGTEFEFEIISVLPWVRRELVADSYGTERVFLVGDAAHQMSPTGGFGMNTGIGDAIDLAWKLKARLAGWGGPRLLSSYDAERRPVGVRNARESSGNLGRMLAPRTERPPALIFGDEPGADEARREFGERFAEAMRREWFSLRIHLGYAYVDSPICLTEPDHEPIDDGVSYIQTTVPGARAPHVWLADGTSTLDLFGRGFVLLRLGPEPPESGALLAAAARCSVPLRAVDVPDEAAAEAYAHRLVLVRPDGHVAWRSNDAPDDDTAGRIIDLVRGAVASAPSPAGAGAVAS